MQQATLRWSETRALNTIVVIPEGRIDSTNSDDFRAALLAALGSGEMHVVLDCIQLNYLTSAAFRTLLVTLDEAQRRNVQFVLCNMSARVRALFEMTGLLEAFSTCETREAALELVK